MARPDPQDTADVQRVLAGDARAFEGLVQRHGRRAYDVARRMLRDPHEAEDAVQHAFLNAYKALARFDTTRPFRHWILRITSNLCRNRIAARKVRGKLLSPTGGEETPPDPPAGPGRPDDPLAIQGRAADLREAIEALPEKYRLAVVLKYLHELPLEEISRITEVPVATVKTHLHRGRAALRRLLAESETEPEAGGTA
ncbi:MAG: sigma-70 family RNA polymerase sigma factor [Planctomycetota bacterium]|nr:sigma-70 family RNA polymerase sigma factor [Planctomycetota bacterium]